MRDEKGNIALLLPGMIILMLGLVTLLAPRLVLAVIAGVLIFFGVSVLMIGWRVFRLKRELDKTSRDFGSIRVEQVRWSTPSDRTTPEDIIEVVEDKGSSRSRVIFH